MIHQTLDFSWWLRSCCRVLKLFVILINKNWENLRFKNEYKTQEILNSERRELSTRNCLGIFLKKSAKLMNFSLKAFKLCCSVFKFRFTTLVTFFNKNSKFVPRARKVWFFLFVFRSNKIMTNAFFMNATELIQKESRGARSEPPWQPGFSYQRLFVPPIFVPPRYTFVPHRIHVRTT